MHSVSSACVFNVSRHLETQVMHTMSTLIAQSFLYRLFCLGNRLVGRYSDQ